MEKVLAAIQHLRAVQAELSRKERELHVAVTNADEDSMRKLHQELPELFQRSRAAFARLQAEFERAEIKRVPRNGHDRH